MKKIKKVKSQHNTLLKEVIMKKEKIKPVERITPYEAGKVLHKNAETIRAGLRQGIFNFGTAIPPKKTGGNWNYIIIKSKFLKYIGDGEVNTNENR